ncbi:hypothetical protein V8E53_010089 [Lactarius tabidus]
MADRATSTGSGLEFSKAKARALTETSKREPETRIEGFTRVSMGVRGRRTLSTSENSKTKGWIQASKTKEPSRRQHQRTKKCKLELGDEFSTRGKPRRQERSRWRLEEERFWGRLRCEDEGRGEDLNSGPLSGEQFAGEVERKIDWKIERIDAGWSTISGVIQVHEDHWNVELMFKNWNAACTVEQPRPTKEFCAKMKIPWKAQRIPDRLCPRQSHENEFNIIDDKLNGWTTPEAFHAQTLANNYRYRPVMTSLEFSNSSAPLTQMVRFHTSAISRCRSSANSARHLAASASLA